MITKSQFMSYERVRKSGATNMFNLTVVQSLSNLTKEQILEIMENFDELRSKYLKEKK